MLLRKDLNLIASIIPPDSKVLDIGCGDGKLLVHLRQTKNIKAQGLELSGAGVQKCLSKGLSVIQGDADTDLADYPNGSFDYAVLSQTIQATHNPLEVLENLVRIGKYAIVSFPNFGYWKVRFNLLWGGKMPKTKDIPHNWYDTPNIHLCTIADFVAACESRKITIQKAMVPNGVWKGAFSNLLDHTAVFLIKRR